MKQEKMRYGFLGMIGDPWPDSWVDTYNRLSTEIEAASKQGHCVESRLDERHRFFMSCLSAANKPEKNSD